MGALGHLAVAQKHVGGIGQLIQVLGIQGDAHADGQALPQGAGGCLGVAEAHGGMAFQGAAEVAVGHEVRGRKPPGHGPQRIKEGRGVTLGKDEPVVVGVLGVIQVVPEDAAEHKPGHQFNGRQRRRRVAGAGLGGHGQDRVAHQGGQFLQVLQLLRVGHVAHPPGVLLSNLAPVVWSMAEAMPIDDAHCLRWAGRPVHNLVENRVCTVWQTLTSLGVVSDVEPRAHACFWNRKPFLQATRLFLNLTTKPRLAISRGHKDGSLVVHREGQFGPIGADRGHQGD